MAADGGLISRLLGWFKLSADESSGQVSAQGVGSNDATDGEEEREGREEIENCALPGFGAVAEKDDLLLVLRRDDGGIAIAAYTLRPGGSKAGDRFVSHKAGHFLRLTTDGADEVFEIKNATKIHLGSDLTLKAVMRTGDKVVADTNMTAWFVAAAGMLGLPTPTDFGVCSTGSTVVKAG